MGTSISVYIVTEANGRRFVARKQNKSLKCVGSFFNSKFHRTCKYINLQRLVFMKWKRSQLDSHTLHMKNLDSYTKRHQVKGKM